MSLKFVFGPSGAGKSRLLYEKLIADAALHKKKNYLVIVPDQFTMQTQKDLVTLSPTGGIMNIDVLSFGRLNHRIMEEVGREPIPVLDDTGKSLVLQKVAAGVADQMPALGSFLQKQGYIHEVKSAISEFMQYGISADEVTKLIDYAGKRGALAQKLRDLQVIYRSFLEYIQGSFITTEETLDVLCKALPKSKLLQGSVVVFDGFTGFTPIQYRVIRELMVLCDRVILTVSMGAGENPYEQDGEQKLFHLGKKTVSDLDRLAKEAGVEREKDWFVLPVGEKQEHAAWISSLEEKATVCLMERNRFEQAPALYHLEKNLFRYGQEPYTQPQSEICLFETTNPAMEVRQTGLKIKELVAKEGLAFRDIAVVVGNLESYAPYVETEFEQMEIPCFIDRTRGIVLNPCVEYIKSALALYLHDFAYDDVFRYLRCGLSSLTAAEVDELELYVQATGTRGRKNYGRMFVRKPRYMKNNQEALTRVNELRERMMKELEKLQPASKAQVAEYVNMLYEFLVDNEVQNRLQAFENSFGERGERTREREYAQIYRLVMELLEQVYELLGQETITLQEFSDILEAGFGEIEVGAIPQNVDRIVVGDMERSRLKQIKVLFFLGVNDGNIPKNVSKGGLISDVDREFLRESELELAPSPRQQMYIQRLYLYMNMTKPSMRLYLSYSKMDSAGKSLRPAYLIDTVKKLFPGLTAAYPELESPIRQIVTGREGEAYLAAELREYVQGTLAPEKEGEFFTIYDVFNDGSLAEKRGFLTEAAFRRYRESTLSKAVAKALYGLNLENSVSRLETQAACAYRQFLQYGLSLQEKQEYGFERVDLGNVYHEVLEKFGKTLEEKKLSWFTFDEEYARGSVKKALEECAAEYGETVLYSSARNVYAISRMERVLVKTVLTLQEHLKRGSFTPESYEASFHFTNDLDSLNIALSDTERMRLRGRIDRIDTVTAEDRLYVKIIDYKSGDRSFDLAALYNGLQLQLVLYMNAALELESKQHPDMDIVPAAMLYYHIDDPVVKSEEEPSEEELNAAILKELKMKGVISAEPGIVDRLDGEMDKSSDIIPVAKKQDGNYTKASSVLSGEDLQTLSAFVTKKITKLGRDIVGGTISLNPYEKGQESACTYCPYKDVCGFETSMPGCEKRVIPQLSKEDAMELIKQEMREEGGEQ